MILHTSFKITKPTNFIDCRSWQNSIDVASLWKTTTTHHGISAEECLMTVKAIVEIYCHIGRYAADCAASCWLTALPLSLQCYDQLISHAQ